MKKLFLPLMGIALSFSIHSASASFIQPDTAVASTAFSSGFSGLATNTIDGSGLSAGLNELSTHGDYASGNHWTTTGGPPTNESISWGFNTAQTLDSIYLWNHQSTVPTAGNSGYDVTLFDLTLFDSSSAILLNLNNLSLAIDLNTAQSFSFGGVYSNVSSVLFEIRGVESSTSYTGLAEVGFNTVTAPIPEPASWLLLLIGSAGFIQLYQRKQHQS